MGDGDPAEVEHASLPVADAGEGVLDLDALAQFRAPFGGLLALALLGEQFLVGGGCASCARCRWRCISVSVGVRA
jgi:hypothetical protein